MKVLVAGDWHGEIRPARRALQYAQLGHCAEVWQVGDYGYGWRFSETGDAFSESVSRYAAEVGINVYWCDGNHENFDKMEENGIFPGRECPIQIAPAVYYIPRGTLLVRNNHRILVIGGAYSVDKAGRIPHISWWAQEEITQADLEKCYEHGEVDVVLSHDAPNSAFIAALSIAAGGDASEMDHLVWKNDRMFPGAAPNRYALQSVLESAQPKLWVHGHYHAAYEAELFNAARTKVLGLDMECEEGSLAVLDFDLPTVEYERIPLDNFRGSGIVVDPV